MCHGSWGLGQAMESSGYGHTNCFTPETHWAVELGSFALAIINALNHRKTNLLHLKKTKTVRVPEEAGRGWVMAVISETKSPAAGSAACPALLGTALLPSPHPCLSQLSSATDPKEPVFSSSSPFPSPQAGGRAQPRAEPQRRVDLYLPRLQGWPRL